MTIHRQLVPLQKLKGEIVWLVATICHKMSQCMQRKLCTSLKEISYDANTKPSTVRQILKKNKYRPHKERKLQRLLLPNDFPWRINFCNWLMEKKREDSFLQRRSEIYKRRIFQSKYLLCVEIRSLKPIFKNDLERMYLWLDIIN